MAGANPAMVVRIAANIAELRKALEEGRDIIATTTAGMERMVKSFSGDRLIQQAHNVVAAINEIGGISKLTASEQERVNSTIGRAIEKYQALGRDAPSAMVALEAATRSVDKSTSDWSKTVSDFKTQFLATMTGFLSAEAIIGAVKGAFNGLISVMVSVKDAIVNSVLKTAELGDEFFTLSNQTGIAVEKLTEWKYVADQTGTSLESITGAVFKLQANLGTGGKEVSDALKEIGLSVAELKTLKPDEAFEQLIAKLKTVPLASEQASLGVKLFGKGFKEVAGLMREDVDQLMNRFRELGGGITTEMAAAGDAFHDAQGDWNVLVERIQTSIGAAILPAATAFINIMVNLVSKALNDTGVSAKTFETIVTDAFSGIVDGAGLLLQAIAEIAKGVGEFTSFFAERIKSDFDMFARIGEKWHEFAASVALSPELKEQNERAAQSYRDMLAASEQAAEGATGLQAKLRALADTVSNIGAQMKGKGAAALEEVRQSIQATADAMRKAQDDLGKGTAIIGEKATGPIADFAKKLKELTLEIDTAKKNGTDLATLIHLFGDAALDASIKAKAFGLSVKQSLQDVASGEVAKRFSQMFADFSKQSLSFAVDWQKNITGTIKTFTLEATENTKEFLDGWMRARQQIVEATRQMTENVISFIRNSGGVLDVQGKVQVKTKELATTFKEMGLALSLLVPGAMQTFTAFAAELEKPQKRSQELFDSIRNLSRAFSELAQTSGGLKDFAKSVGEITSALSIAVQVGEEAGRSLRTAFQGTVFDPETGEAIAGRNADLEERSAAVLNLVGTVIQGIAAIDAATQGSSVGAAILRGAITGAGFGAAIGTALSSSAWAGPIGAAFGAIAGGLIGAIRAAADKSDEVMAEVGRDLGIGISGSLSKQIEQDAKIIFGGTSAGFRTVARAFNLDAIIKEQGGIRTATMFEKFTGELHNMLGFVEQGRMTAEQAVDAIGRAFPAFAEYLSNSRELATRTWTDFLEHHKNLGLKTKEITDFVVSGAGRIATAIGGMLGPVLKEYGGLADKIAKTTDAAELAGLLEKQAEGAAKAGESLKQMGTLALSAFSAAREQGATYLQALRATTPAVQQLIGVYRDLGLALPTADENFALRWLLDQQALIDKMPELVTAQEAVNEAALAFSHIGKLNVENLSILGAQAARTYDQMIAGGFGSAEALAQVQDFLRLARQRYQELGAPIDENTQRLLDMADAAGLSTEPMRTTGQVFEEVADTLKEGLGAIITLLGGELPKSWQTAAAATEQATTESEKSVTDMRLKVASEYQVIIADSQSKSGQVSQTWKNCWNRSTWGKSDIDHMFDQVVSGAEDAAGQVEGIFDTLTLPTLELGYKYILEGEAPSTLGGGGETLISGEAGFRSVVVAGSTGPVTLINPTSPNQDLLSEMRRMNQLLAKSSDTPDVVVVPLGPDESWESFSARLSRTMPSRVAKSATLQDAWRRAVPNR